LAVFAFRTVVTKPICHNSTVHSTTISF